MDILTQEHVCHKGVFARSMATLLPGARSIPVHRGGHAVGVVAGRYGGAVRQDGHQRIRVEERRGPASSFVGVCDAGVSRQQGVPDVRGADARVAEVGLDRGRRVSRDIAVPQDVPATDGAVRGDVAGFRGAGGVFDGDVEAGAGEGVILKTPMTSLPAFFFWAGVTVSQSRM
ncbi:hypothetical protein MRS44_013292 [Fusarium solani]|uniref:uncharacterized protein n=1 Tax=Fusarium solani TaxID=169388 RepID=UPI0032C44D50|nr:hypothetical protein MRS44_013292 [Fusarium solani]